MVVNPTPPYLCFYQISVDPTNSPPGIDFANRYADFTSFIPSESMTAGANHTSKSTTGIVLSSRGTLLSCLACSETYPSKNNRTRLVFMIQTQSANLPILRIGSCRVLYNLFKCHYVVSNIDTMTSIPPVIPAVTLSVSPVPSGIGASSA